MGAILLGAALAEFILGSLVLKVLETNSLPLDTRSSWRGKVGNGVAEWERGEKGRDDVVCREREKDSCYALQRRGDRMRSCP